MSRLPDPFTRLHDHYATFHPSQQQQQLQHPQLDPAARLAEAKQRAIASIRRSHKPTAPTPLSQVHIADDESTDEAPTSPRSMSSPCPPSRIMPGEGRSLFERTNFKRNPGGGDGMSLSERVSFAPTGPMVDREERRREETCSSGSVTRKDGGTKPLVFLREDPQLNKVETAWNSGMWTAAAEAPSGLYKDAAAVAAQAAEIPSPWKVGGREDTMEEHVPLPAETPPNMVAWARHNQVERQQASAGVRNSVKPPGLNLGKHTAKTPSNLSSPPAFQPLASAVWKTPMTASFVPPPRAPLPASSSTQQALSVQATAPRALTTISTSTCQPPIIQSPYTHQPQSGWVTSTAPMSSISALSFHPPLSPPLSSDGCRPRLPSSIYLACLAVQDTKVILKCKMRFCQNREGVRFGKESLRYGVVERYRQSFGCAGCGEMLDLVVCG